MDAIEKDTKYGFEGRLDTLIQELSESFQVFMQQIYAQFDLIASRFEEQKLLVEEV